MPRHASNSPIRISKNPGPIFFLARFVLFDLRRKSKAARTILLRALHVNRAIKRALMRKASNGSILWNVFIACIRYFAKERERERESKQKEYIFSFDPPDYF